MPRSILMDNGVEEGNSPNWLLQARKMAQVLAPHVPSAEEIEGAELFAIPLLLPQAVSPQHASSTQEMLVQDLRTFAQKTHSYDLSDSQYHRLFQWIAIEFGCGSITDEGWMSWAALVARGNQEAFFQAMPSLLSRDILEKKPNIWNVPTDEVWTVINTWEKYGFLCGLHVDSTHPFLLAENISYNLVVHNEFLTDPWPREHYSAGRIPKVVFDDRREQFSVAWPYLHDHVVGNPPMAVVLN